MARLRYNGLSNSLGASLTSGATSVTFASKLTYAGGDVPTISGDYLPLSILDSDGLCAELVHLTAYTSGATTGTIARGKEDTSAAAHDSGVTVVNGPTVADLPTLLGSSEKTSNQSGITTNTDVTDLSVTVDVDTNRLYRVDVLFRCAAIITTGSGHVRAYLELTDSSDTSLCNLVDAEGYAASPATKGARGVGTTTFYHEPSSSGSFTYKVRAKAIGTNAECLVLASSTAPCTIHVWDLGEA